ncbi:MAG TPA: hypothetical protein VK897_02485 [Anaerolineales bacterium]|nr:hypothetical protein [Anaerolineales bacterium]
MNRWMIGLFTICVAAVLILTACQPKAKTLLPVTGGQGVSLAAPAASARDSVLEYILSSSRLAALPPGTDWELVQGEHPSEEYHFRNGDWLMLVQLANGHDARQRIILLNRVEKISWSGYITPEGRLVDTAYGR